MDTDDITNAASAMLAAHPGKPMVALLAALKNKSSVEFCLALATNELCGVNCQAKNDKAFDKGIAFSVGIWTITPLGLAAAVGRLDVMEELIAQGALVNPEGVRSSNTPLAIAISVKNVAAAELLLENAASVAVAVDEAVTPLHLAAENDTVAILIPKLCDLGADVHAQMKYSYGDTPLHVAAYKGCLSAIKALVARGADMNFKNQSNSTPLFQATDRCKHPKAVQLLLGLGADPDIFKFRYEHKPDTVGEYPLHQATHRYESVSEAQLLLAYGASVNVVDNHGYTPLHGAVRTYGKHCAYFAQLLADAGADLEAKTKDGHTPLRIAIGFRRKSRSDDYDSDGCGNADAVSVLEKEGAALQR